MAHLIVGHGVSWCFGASLAPEWVAVQVGSWIGHAEP